MIFLELSQQSLKCTKKDLLLFLFPFAILRKDSIISHVTNFNSLLALTKLDYFLQTFYNFYLTSQTFSCTIP